MTDRPTGPRTRPLSAPRTFRLAGTLNVHRLGFGAMRLTGPGIWGDPPDRDDALALLRRAVDLGVDFIDTAEAYGPHTNETLIKDALHPYRESLVIATKGGGIRPAPGEWEAVGRPGFLRQGVETSLYRLGLDRIDLYQLHRIDGQVPLEDQLGTLKELQDAGKIRHIGLSEAGVEQIEAARRVVEIVSVQNQYGLHDRGWEAVVDHCARENIAFIAWAPLGSGTLAGGPEGDRAEGRPVEGLEGVSASRLALAWLLHRSATTLAIPGTTSPEHLAENLSAAELALTDEQFSRLSALPEG